MYGDGFDDEPQGPRNYFYIGVAVAFWVIVFLILKSLN